MAEDEAVVEDALLGGRVRLLQPTSGHRAGTDAVLVAGLAGAKPGDRIVDLGSASGAIGLMLAAAIPDARLVLAERDPALVALARRNIDLNGFEGRVGAVSFDVFAPAPVGPEEWPGDLVPPGGADLVVTNPPFFEAGTRVSPNAGRRAAHMMEGGTLEGWIEAASRLLRPRGRLVLIHRADGLAACLAALAPRLGGIGLRAVHPGPDKAASRIVLSATKAGRAPLVISPPLVLHGEDGRFTPEAERLHRP